MESTQSTRAILYLTDGDHENIATFSHALGTNSVSKDNRDQLAWIACRPVRNDDDDNAAAEVFTTIGGAKWRLSDRPDASKQRPHDPIPGTSANLCAACEDIEIGPLLSNGPSSWHWLGSYDDVGACRFCDLCRLVRRGLELSLRTQTDPIPQNGDNFIVLEPVSSIVPLPRARRRRPYELRVTLLQTDTRHILASASIRLLGSCAERIGKSPAFFGRHVDPKAADMKLARKWLDECLLTHNCAKRLTDEGESVSQVGDDEAGAVGTTLDELRVVDIVRGKLCTIPWTERYAALSYVWPRFDTLRLTRQNTKALHLPGALFPSSSPQIGLLLPRVIRDAMDIVCRLGERYLWVDALCITQDDDVEKASLIRAMDRVYGGSLLTLVVATSASPEEDYGIPGVNGTPRTSMQHSAELEGLVLVTGLRGPESVIDSSVWSTRGWTLQEGLLSRRCLIFSDDQLYFRCPRDYRCEEIQDEGPRGESEEPCTQHPAKPRTRRGRQGHLEYLLGDQFLNNASREDTFRTYAQIVSSYTPRNLTDPADILNALEGVMTALLPHFPEPRGFLAGCPMHMFDRAVLWYPTGSGRLRRRSICKEHPLPSWSWVSWDGGVAYERDLHALGDFESQRPMLSWWRRGEGGGEGTFLVPVRNYYHQLHEGTALSHGMLVSRAQNMTSTQLIFWGKCTKFFVSKAESRTVHWLDDSELCLPCFTILDANGDPCGFLPSADREWAASHVDDTQHYEFLLLSAADQSPFDNVDERAQWFHPKYRTPARSDNFHNLCFMNVMLLEYDDEGVAYRRGVGRVHMNIYLAQELQLKIIILG